jgi:probable rRNA maturation factor
MPASLRISITAHCGGAHASFIRRQLIRAHRMLRSPLAELSIALVGDRRMSDLHLRFMSMAGPTDVLTFPLEIDATGNTLSGEVVICIPEARRRAREHGTRLSHEILLYAVHGMLHLSGYDDRTAREFKVMHRKEDDLLTRLGAGAVFAPKGSKPAGFEPPGLTRRRMR